MFQAAMQGQTSYLDKVRIETHRTARGSPTREEGQTSYLDKVRIETRRRPRRGGYGSTTDQLPRQSED